MEEIYTHKFVIVEAIESLREPLTLESDSVYDVAVRHRDGSTFVVEATSERADAMDVAHVIGSAFDSWLPDAPEPEPPVAPYLREALLQAAEVLWGSVNERCPFDEVVDHVTELMRGFLPPEVADTVIEWADECGSTLTEALEAWWTKSQRRLTAWQVVLQSQVIHPEWNAVEHGHFLMDEGYDVSALGVEDETPLRCIRRWLDENLAWPGGPVARAGGIGD